jgi:hypothetical protein
MDIYCKHCGEPWGVYALHDMDDPKGSRLLPYPKAAKLFAKLGCGAFDGHGKECISPMVDPVRAERAELAQCLSDYPDDWASDCDW